MEKQQVIIPKTPYQIAYSEFSDMFSFLKIFDNNKNTDICKSELFCYLYRMTWEEQCRVKGIAPTGNSDEIERGLDYELFRKNMRLALNNQISRYTISERKNKNQK